MSVRSNVFGSVMLSKEDAEQFRKQVAYGRPKKAARDSFAKGKPMLDEFQREGRVRIHISEK